MGGLDHVAGEVVVGHNCAADGGHADGLALDTQLVNGFGHQAVDDAVGAAGAVMQRRISQRMGFLENSCHDQLSPFCALRMLSST